MLFVRSSLTRTLQNCVQMSLFIRRKPSFNMSPVIRPRAGDFISVVPVLLLCLLYNSGVVTGDRPVAFFAFGDSYADTGNSNQSISPAWYPPYGETWPGHAAGRFSDGRVQTDILAKMFHLPSPRPLAFVKSGASAAKGVNFASAGAGVTVAFGIATLTTQVDELLELVANGYFDTSDSSAGTKQDISGYFSKSVALVCVAGNDYIAYSAQNGSVQIREGREGGIEIITVTATLTGTNLRLMGLPAFVKTVVGRIELNLRRLYKLGIRKMIVENLTYTPCFPLVTQAHNYTKCSGGDEALWLHNALLKEAISQLDGDLLGVDIIFLNQSKAIQYIITHPRKFGITEPVRPCCEGTTAGTVCASVDNKGLPLYTLCEDPSKHFFWDIWGHLTEHSWKSVIRLWLLADGYTVNGPRLKTWIKHLEF